MSPHRSNTLSVLVIDDDELVHEIFRVVADNGQFDLCTVFSVEDAMNCLERFRPDVIVIDLFMNKRNGFQALETLKQFEYSAHCYFVAMTAYYSSVVEIRTVVEGFDAYLEKPLNAATLAECLRSFKLPRL